MNFRNIKTALAAVSFCISPIIYSQTGNISMNVAGAASTNPAILDLSDASNAHLGFLMPNVSLANNTDILTIPAPTTGMIVWNTNSGMPFGAGYYYWDGSHWDYLFNSGSSVAGANLTAGTGITSFTYNGTSAATVGLANSGVTAGTYGSTSVVPQITVNAQGQITSETNKTITPASIGMQNLSPGTGLTGSTYNGSAAISNWGVSYGSTAGTAVQGNTQFTISPGTGMSGGGTITEGAGGTLTLTNNGVVSANNGLSVTSNNVQLGGTLSVNPTTITQAGNALTVAGGAINLNNSGSSATTIGNGGTGTVVIGNSTGKVGVNQSSPVSQLDVNGGVTVGSYSGTNAAPSNGMIVSGQVGIGNNLPKSSANLDLSNTTNQAFLLATNTNPGVNIASPVAGEVIYNSTIGCPEFYNGSGWYPFSVPGSAAAPTAFTISGPGSECTVPGSVTYSVTAVAGTLYNWVYSGTAVTYVSGQGTNSLVLNIGSGTVNLYCIETTCGGNTQSNIISYTVGTPSLYVDATSVANPGTSASPFTSSITTHAANEIVVVVVDAYDVTTATAYNGTLAVSGAATIAAFSPQVSKVASDYMSSAIYAFAAPTAGTYTVTITTARWDGYPAIFCASLEGFCTAPTQGTLTSFVVAGTTTNALGTCSGTSLSCANTVPATANGIIIGGFSDYNCAISSVTDSWTGTNSAVSLGSVTGNSVYNNSAAYMQYTTGSTSYTLNANIPNTTTLNYDAMATLIVHP